MRAYPRAQIADDDAVVPMPVLAELREVAHVANQGLDYDNIEDAVLAITKFEQYAFGRFYRHRETVDSVETVLTTAIQRQWRDIADMSLSVSTEDTMLEITLAAKFEAVVTFAGPVPTQGYQSRVLGIFVDGGLVGLSPPTGEAMDAVASARGSAYVCVMVPVGPGTHLVQGKWLYLNDPGNSLDESRNITWKARQLYIWDVAR